MVELCEHLRRTWPSIYADTPESSVCRHIRCTASDTFPHVAACSNTSADTTDLARPQACASLGSENALNHDPTSTAGRLVETKHTLCESPGMSTSPRPHDTLVVRLDLAYAAASRPCVVATVALNSTMNEAFHSTRTLTRVMTRDGRSSQFPTSGLHGFIFHAMNGIPSI